MSAISNKNITGIETRKSESGSGGEKTAPITNAPNQMCFRYDVRTLGSTIPTRNARRVTTGA